MQQSAAQAIPVAGDDAPILVADDNPVDRRILARFVAGEGYRVVEARDGVEALELFHEVQPQLVLLDALMPGMDGFEVAQQIKVESSDRFVPVIFLTALTGAEDLARCLSAGGDDFLSKPYNRIILKAKLEAVQRQKQLHETLRAQRDAIDRSSQQLLRDQETAKATFDRIAHREHLEQPGITYLSSPLALFNGDVLLAAPTPRGTLNVLVGDFTGHGLTASVGALPLAESFYSLTARGYSLRAIVRECNQRLGQILTPGTFCCAAFIELSPARLQIEYWNGGLPPAYLISDSGDPRSRELPARHLPLGLLQGERFDDRTETLSVRSGDRMLLMSDGVIERSNAQEEQFGSERLQHLLDQLAPGSSAVACVLTALDEFSGTGAQEDDLTIFEVVVDPDVRFNFDAGAVGTEAALAPPVWSMRYQVCDEALAAFDPVAVLGPLLQGVPALRPALGDIGLVLSELFANALEHGVLGLDSALKEGPAGFAEYFAIRTRRLAAARGSVCIELTCGDRSAATELKILVTDSGRGFLRAAEPTAFPGQDIGATPELHGRGLKLIHRLCAAVRHLNEGRTTEVVFNIPKEVAHVAP